MPSFDALYRKHLTSVYLALGQIAPEELAKPIKRKPEHALQVQPTGFLTTKIEWPRHVPISNGSALAYIPLSAAAGSMHGRDLPVRRELPEKDRRVR